jgi:hypothetical protein
VVDDFAPPSDPRHEIGIAQIPDLEVYLGLVAEVLERTGRQVVEPYNIIAVGKQPEAQTRSDEAGGSRNQTPHALSS